MRQKKMFFLFLFLFAGLVFSGGCAYNLDRLASRPMPEMPVTCEVKKPKIVLVKNQVKTYGKTAGILPAIAQKIKTDGQMILPYLKDRLPCATINVADEDKNIDANAVMVKILGVSANSVLILPEYVCRAKYLVVWHGKKAVFSEKCLLTNWIGGAIFIREMARKLPPKLADDITAWLLKQGAVKPSDIAEKYRDRIIKLAEKMDTAQASTASRGGK